MSMLSEFKDFAMKGNVVDMAVGVVIGGAFKTVVTSFTNDILMPSIGLLLGGVDFSNLAINLKDAQADAAAPAISYGVFINTVLDFLIIAFAIFMIVKAMNAAKKEEAAASGVGSFASPTPWSLRWSVAPTATRFTMICGAALCFLQSSPPRVSRAPRSVAGRCARSPDHCRRAPISQPTPKRHCSVHGRWSNSWC